MSFAKQTLYGLDKKDSYKQWSIWTVKDKLFIEHGKEGGKLQLKEETVKGKNIGKANETTPTEQAIFEAESRINKQFDKGYRFHKNDLQSLPLLPMLAQDYHKHGHRIKYPCLASYKMDGVRCLAFWRNNDIVLLSRGGKEYTVKHIQEGLQGILCLGDILDAELYIHGMYLEDIVSAVKKPNENTPKLQLVAFDKVSNQPFRIRQLALEADYKRYQNGYFKIMPYVHMEDEIQLKKFHNHAVSKKYEGVMLRNLEGMYESGKRSADLQKYKTFLDNEFKILEVSVDKNGAAVFTVQNIFADNTFNVQYGTHEQRVEQYKNRKKYIGKMITVQYQTLYKDTLLPQFPTGKAIRDYE